MKRWFPIVSLWSMMVLAACRPSVETRQGTPLPAMSLELTAIDSLMWQQPDSAFVLLQEFAASPEADSLDAFGGHYFQLLLSELLYKNYCEQSNRDELQKAVAYFDSLFSILNDKPSHRHLIAGTDPLSLTRKDDLVFLAARAHYINGVGFYESDSMVEACKEYLKTLEVMEGHFEEKIMAGKKAQFMALTYTRLTDLFADLYLHEQAIYFAQHSITYYKKTNMPSWNTARMLNEIGSQYDMMKQLDRATYYYQKAIHTLDDTTTLIYRDIAAHLICIEYKRGSCQADAATKRLRQLLQSSESDRESQARYQYIGETFYHVQRYDSAWVYLNHVFQTTSIVGLKRQAAEWLVDICKIQGRDDAIIEYANFLVPFANQEENQSATKSELAELYKALGQAQQEKQHQEEMRQHRNRSITVVEVSACIALIIIALLYYYNKKRKRHYENQIEAERQAHKMQQAALAGRLKQSHVTLKEHLKRRTENNVTDSLLPKAEEYEDELVCQHILSLCNDKKNPIKTTVAVASYDDIALTDTQKAELKKAALAHFAPLFDKLKQQHPELKEKDFLYCYLCLLGLDNAQIAVMLQLSHSTIWEREKRLKRILGSEERIAIILRGYMIT